MILSTPTSPATWLFTALTMIDIPIQVYQLFDPESTMQRFQVNPVASRLIATLLLAINAYDLVAALQKNIPVLWISCLARLLGYCVFVTGGEKWKSAANAQGLLTMVIFLALWLS
ncbi:hypothetical protein CNMCM6805_002445 [Aspergillus fumigatiaffinis]|uniref:Uncharacterized protein n=1 Tax=Aspergillus fumigatiaffinis TaxID=340414 RepID=A0A8H4HDH8_9EURO|nr:hypothetical protein CNMCM5878_005770 [Aspergillus fumigatiaffinis]KAF4241345.1 hypothetical protein CNMCM6457_006448 [Aspergillus fumigatiaffinis]KAF4242821.1 hypothetical protein CNMCM6805_002445 [Aspergillus fumigatiaffinis]